MLLTEGFLVNFKNPQSQKVKRLPSDIGVSAFENGKFRSTDFDSLNFKRAITTSELRNLGNYSKLNFPKVRFSSFVYLC